MATDKRLPTQLENEEFRQEPEWLLPFESMEVGDSFFIPTLHPKTLAKVIDVTAARAGVKVKYFITRNSDDIYGLRIWRVKA